MHRKILIIGLPGAGKTTLAHALAPRLNAVHFNADDVRREIHSALTMCAPGSSMPCASLRGATPSCLCPT
jgi:predicted kinase